MPIGFDRPNKSPSLPDNLNRYESIEGRPLFAELRAQRPVAAVVALHKLIGWFEVGYFHVLTIP